MTCHPCNRDTSDVAPPCTSREKDDSNQTDHNPWPPRGLMHFRAWRPSNVKPPPFAWSRSISSRWEFLENTISGISDPMCSENFYTMDMGRDRNLHAYSNFHREIVIYKDACRDEILDAPPTSLPARMYPEAGLSHAGTHVLGSLKRFRHYDLTCATTRTMIGLCSPVQPGSEGCPPKMCADEDGDADEGQV